MRWSSGLTRSKGRPILYVFPFGCFLGLHAVCAKVAQMSGAARLLDELEEELEGLNVLAGDGSSAEHLAHRLAAIS